MSNLTKQFVESEIEPPATGQRFYRDDDLPGFAIRVTPKSKAYIFEKRVDGVNRRITIGKFSEMSLDSAKKQACIMLGDLAKGNDPRTGRRITSLPDITLREVLQKFLEIKPIRKDTKQGYHYVKRICLYQQNQIRETRSDSIDKVKQELRPRSNDTRSGARENFQFHCCLSCRL